MKGSLEIIQLVYYLNLENLTLIELFIFYFAMIKIIQKTTRNEKYQDKIVDSFLLIINKFRGAYFKIWKCYKIFKWKHSKLLLMKI